MMLSKVLKSLRHFVRGYYNLLLLFLIILFIFRPYESSFFYLGVWQLFLAGTLLSAIFNCNHKRGIKIATLILAIPAVICSWINLLHPEMGLFVASAVFTILFMFVCTCSILFDVVLRAKVTLETLRGVVCAYFMVAFAFAYIFYLIEYLVPGSFHLIHRQVSVFSYTEYLSEMLYFSFITLLTIGFGDITALLKTGQTAVVIEGIIGQFYVAILVARIVSVYAFHSDKRLLKAIEKDIIKSK